MKKFVTVFSLLVLTAGVLAGCNSKKGGGKKGKEPDENAWNSIFSQSIFNGSTAAYDDIDNPVKPEASSGSSTAPYARLALSNGVRPQFSTDYFECTFEYKYSVTVGGEEKNADDYIEDTIKHDIVDTESKKTHTVQVVAYKGWPSLETEEADYPHFTIEATAKTNGYTQTRSYTMVLYPSTYVYHKGTLADFYTKHSSLDALQFMRKKSEGQYENDSGNPDNTFYNIETQGKLIYITDDGNWGIMQDGDKYIELYHLDYVPIFETIREHCLGKNIWVKGSLGYGYGNIQISDIKSILPIKDGDTSHPVGSPSSEKSFSEADLSDKSWWDKPIFNAVGSVQGGAKVTDGVVYKVQNAKGGATTSREEVKDKSSIVAYSSRYEFEVTIGSTTVVVGTDYHACCNAEQDGYGSEGEAFTNLLKNLTAGQTINLKGTVRWLNDRGVAGGNDHSIYTSGAWTITPYLASHIQ